MPIPRRSLLIAAGATTPLLLAKPAPARAQQDLSTPEGWLNWVSAHRDAIGLAIDDGRGHRLAHAADTPRPLASAVKVLHLAAYAEAVIARRIDPDERVRVGDWERYYVPTDGHAHANALEQLGIPADSSELYAADPEQRVALRDMVSMMLLFSDSAVPDFLRDRLGAHAVVTAGRTRGWRRPDVRSLCAEYLFLALPETAPPPRLPVAARQAWGFALERRYRDEPALRRRVRDWRLHQPMPPLHEQAAWASSTAAGSPRELDAVHRALASGSDPASTLAREHLEAPATGGALPPGVDGIGFKGGSLPGVATAGASVRRSDGTIGTGGLVAHDPAARGEVVTSNPAALLLPAIRDARWRDRLGAALGR